MTDPARKGGMGGRLRGAVAWSVGHPSATLALWVVWISFLYWAFGWHSYVRIQDNADSALALKLLRPGGIPVSLWAATCAAGVDRFAQLSMNGIDAALTGLLPVWLYSGFLMIAQRAIAAWGTHALLTRRLGLGAGASIWAAMAYSLFAQPGINGSWAGWTTYDAFSLPAIPLLLLVLTARRPPRVLVPVAALAGLLYALTSYAAFAPFCVVFTVAWVLLVGPKEERVRSVPVLGAFVLTWAASEAALVYPSLVNVGSSVRSGWAVAVTAKGLATDALLLLATIRDVLPALAVLAAGLAFRRTRTMTRVAALTAGTAAAVLGSSILTWAASRLGLPAGVQFARFQLVLPFLAVAGAAVAADRLSAERAGGAGGARIAARWALPALVAVTLLSSLAANARAARLMVRGSDFDTIYRDPTMLAVERAQSDTGGRLVTLPLPDRKGIIVHPGFAWGYGIPTADGYLAMYTERYARFWTLVMEPTFRRDPVAARYFGDYGSRIYLAAGSGFPDRADVDMAARYDLDLLSLAGVRYAVSPVPLAGGGFRRMAAIPAGRLLAYENADALPHSFVPARATLLSTSALGQRLRDTSVTELREQALFEVSDVPAGSVPEGTWSGEVLSESRGPDTLTLRVRMEDDGMVVVTENDNGYWKASVDGSPARVLPAYIAFQAIRVPKGEHEVVLAYEPPHAKTIEPLLGVFR